MGLKRTPKVTKNRKENKTKKHTTVNNFLITRFRLRRGIAQ